MVGLNINGKKFLLFFLFSIVIVVVFVVFLLSLVSYAKVDDDLQNFEDRKEFGESSLLIEETKLNLISNDIIEVLSNVTISDMSNNKYIATLIVDDMIVNKDNSIGQEIVHLYLSNNTEIAKNVINIVMELILNKYDEPMDWKWRNYQILLSKNLEYVVLYNHTPLLVDIYNNQIASLDKTSIFLNKYQMYNISFENGSSKLFSVDLANSDISNASTEIFKYVDLGSGKFKGDAETLNTFFEKDLTNEYIFEILIWI